MTEPVVATSGGYERPPLDDVMLAMDVVDTLRRNERLVVKELDEAGREEDLKQRLKRIYAQQGIDVPDHVIEQGVKALKEDRFTYKPSEAGLARKIALVYVKRGRWGKWLVAILVAGLFALIAHYFFNIAPVKALTEDISEQRSLVMALAASDHARTVAQQISSDGSLALRNEDNDAARAALAQLQQLHSTLQQEYTIQVVNRAGERSGVWRIPDVNETAKNYYVIVEAVNRAGQRMKIPVKNEENVSIEQVETWGLRVDESTFNAVARDKQDDGIIQNNRFGSKQRGYLEPEYLMPTSGAAITSW